MGYRELSRMEIVEVIRRWQVGESQRAIARASGVARETVKKYLRAAEELGLAANGPPPSEDQVVLLVQAGRVVSASRTWATPQADRLEPYREQITTWLHDDQIQITRVQELLGQRGLYVTYSTLERFAWRRLGFTPRRGQRGTTVRMAQTPPGEVAEMDFERLGLLLNPETGRRQLVWGLSIVLTYSRHSFLWPLVQQTVEATIEGLEGLRDRDAVYGRDVRQRARRMGIDAIATPIRAPRANAVAERVIGTLRRECLDDLIVLDEQHLASVLTEFVRYYTHERPHRTLGLQTPHAMPRPPSGPIRSRQVLNGLHHVYEHAA